VGHTGGGCCKCSIKANRTEKPFFKKTFFGFEVFKRILRFSGYYVLKYEGIRLPKCKKNDCNNPPNLG